MSRLPKTISVEKLDNSVLFTFAQNQHYLYDGTIEVPFNSLSIIADKSEAITLRKSASNDIFISAPWENFDITASSKEDVVDALTDMLYDETGGGVSREEVEDMIDAATSGIPSSQTIEQLRNDVNTISGNVQTLSGEVATKADASDLQALSEKVDTKLDASAYTPTDLSEYWTSAETKSYVDGALDDYYDKDYVDAALADKLDASAYTPTDLSDYWTSAETQNAINAATSGIPSSQVIEQLRTDVNTISGDVENKQDALEYYSEAEYENGGGRGIINVYNGKTYGASVWANAGNTDGGTYARLYAKGDAGENTLNVSPTGVTINDAKVLTEYDIDVSDIYNTIDEKEEVVASALTELNLRLNEDEEVTAAALNDLNDRIGSGGGALFVNFDDLMDNMNDDKWDELVNAIQDKKPIFAFYSYSEGDITADIEQSPVDAYVYIDETEGEEQSIITLNQFYTGGYNSLIITKFDSEDYEVTDEGGDYQPTLQAGSGISIDNNVISVSVDSELDETSNNPVANSAVTNVIIDDEEVISRAINELNDRLVAVESGGSSVTVDTSLDSGSTNPVANSAITVALDAKADTSDLTIITNNVEIISGAVDGKQDVLSAGTGIEISGNVISTTGGGVTTGMTYDTPFITSGVFLNGQWYGFIADYGTVNSASKQYVRLTVNGSFVTIAFNGSTDIYDGSGNLIDTPSYINQELNIWDSTNNRRYIFFNDGVYVDYIANTTRLKYTLYTETNSGEAVELIQDHIFNDAVHTTSSEKALWNTVSGKVETSAITSAITSASTNAEVAGAKAVYDAIQAGGGGSVTVDSTLDTGSTNPVANSAITTAINAKQDALYVYTEDRNLGTAELHSNDSSIIFSTGGASITANNVFGINTFNVAGNGVTINGDKVLTESDITSAITSGSTDAQVPSAKATFDALDAKADASTTYTKTEVNNLVNNKFWCGTQTQYDALATKENDVLYLIHE